MSWCTSPRCATPAGHSARSILGLLLALPLWLTESKINLAAVIVIFGIVGFSLVVLTGWAGQVSLGQMAFVGIGAAVGGALTANQGWDISLALLVGGMRRSTHRGHRRIPGDPARRA